GRLRAELDASVPLTGPGTPRAVRPAVHARGNTEKFLPVPALLVRMAVEATTDGLEPCIDELEVWTTGDGPRNVALADMGAIARASSVYPNSPIHRLEHLNDGRYGNGRSWISAEPGRGWVEVRFARLEVIDRITWARDREGKYADRLARTYRIEVAT